MTPLTAILIPTYRNNRQNIATLKYLAAFSSPELHVIISDCSLSFEKHIILKEIENLNSHVKVIYQEKNIPLYKDIINMLDYAYNYEYIAIVPDDDYVSLAYLEKSIEILKKNSGGVCSYGNYIIYQTNGSVFRDSRSALLETAAERIEAGFSPNYFNTMFFAVFRRSAMQPWINYCKSHPLISSFFDFLHCISLIAQGKVICHTEGQFLWVGENWDTSEENHKTRARYYTQMGLPPDFALFHDLHFAIEGVNFLTGKHSPIFDSAERYKCAQIIWSRCMERFRTSVYANPILFEHSLRPSNSAIQALNNLLIQLNCTEKNIIFWFIEILNLFSINKAEEYRNYYFN